ncbi:hypothetical protein H7K28_00690 [Paenibacillus polymyxa]|jgi:similar to spore coat protein|uniref:hypothetical protein n=1 Tax=Paenibacillus TaxID=44249 RepID=UPI000D304D00|nr:MULTISPECIES: hypothetical protein [Paenibacillus]KAF6621485.1 hypothetical protein HFE00_02250 [Paenibacillus sp. EKM101P]KAF6622790.1 hypothetical protein HFE03_11715 [Paenibacillus sp. EKM102P]KAF6632642.1 hypothetical protein HFE01_11755 [Paenibacillus sp. EKM10P]KAF6647394.1 hypothetical protein HFE02_13810 [Paenibacillus sp. EKM11P]MBY0021988.1 hypothetical protein [Paenibacillus polymyxa]
MVYGLHETLEVHELSAFKTVCLTKSKTMQALISDPVLKAILQKDVDLTTRQLQELSNVLNQASSSQEVKQ